LNLVPVGANLALNLTPLGSLCHIHGHTLVLEPLAHSVVDALPRTSPAHTTLILVLLKVQVLPNEGVEMLNGAALHRPPKGASSNLTTHGNASHDARGCIGACPHSTRVKLGSFLHLTHRSEVVTPATLHLLAALVVSLLALPSIFRDATYPLSRCHHLVATQSLNVATGPTKARSRLLVTGSGSEMGLPSLGAGSPTSTAN
jgi:hypothetical protein